MADTAVAITAGSGTNIDTRTESTNSNHRQVVVIGDPSTNAGVAPVDGTTGLAVNITNASLTVASHAVTQSGTWTVQPGNTANTTAWKVDGSAVTQPVSLASVPTHAVTNAGTFATQVDGAALTALQLIDDVVFAEDAAHTSGDKGVMPLAIRRDTTPSSSAGTAGDYTALNADANGRLYVNAAIYDAAGAAITASADYTQDAALTVSTTAGPSTMFRATSAANAAVSADDDAVIGIASLTGKQIVLPYATPAQTWSYAAAAGGLVSTTGVTAKTAAASGVRHYITSAQVINSHATISTEVCIKDGASGTVLHRGWAQAAGGGYAVRFDPPLRGTAATLVEIAEVTATATTGVLVSLQGYSAAE